MIREFAAGVRTLFRGFGVWRTRPGLMALGLVPAIIALVLLAAGRADRRTRIAFGPWMIAGAVLGVLGG